ncbi:retrovirus-related pol polyprotein from transposon TNT 1-94 [Tanacetum coccineum]
MNWLKSKMSSIKWNRLWNNTFEVKMNQALNENEQLLEQVMSKDIVNLIVNSSVDFASMNVHECKKYLKHKTRLQKDFVEKEIYDKLFKRFTTLEKHCISLEVDTQLNQETFQRNNSISNQSAPSFDQLFKLNKLKAQSQAKDMVIKNLKERIKSLSGNMDKDKIKHDLEEIETINIELDHREEAAVLRDLADHIHANYPLDPTLESACKYTKLIQELLTKISKTCPSLNNSGEQLVAVTPMNKVKRVRFTEPVTSSRNTITKKASTSNLASNKPMLSSTGVKPSTSASGPRPSSNTKKDRILQTQSSTQKNKVEVHPRQVKSSLKNKDHVVAPKGTAHVQHSKLNANSELKCVKSSKLSSVKFRNDHVEKILGYGDYHGNVTISRVYYVEGLCHNLFFIGSRGNNLYTLYLGDMMASSPICLLSKASKTKSWLWHRRLSHLNFGAINHLARHGLVRGLPKLKFEKDYLCSACAMDFDELTAMASEHSSSGPALHEMTPATINELLNPPPSVDNSAPEVVAPIDEVAAPVPAISTGASPSSTTVDQDAPSASNSQTIPETQPPVIPNDAEEDNHDIEVANMGNDPYFGVRIPEVPSDQSSSSDSIHTIVQPEHQISKHNNKWTNDHPENIIGELARPVSTRLKLHEQAFFYYYDAFLTAVEPKTYKDALTQACWIEAMQEELNEFERLEVWELVPRPDKVMVIKL